MRRLVQHCRRLLSSLKDQRIRDPLLCDLSLLTSDDRPLRCHKAVLCANSPYFNAMFGTSGFIECAQNEVSVPFDSSVLGPVVEFFYDGYIDLRLDNCLDLLEVADMLLAQDLIAECRSFAAQHLEQVLTHGTTAHKTSLQLMIPVLNKLPKVNLKRVLRAVHDWFMNDAKTRLVCYSELNMAIISRLQEDLEVHLVDDDSQPDNEVYVNFQNIDQSFPNLLKFDGLQWSKCDWPQPDDLPSGCEHFCIVEYGKSLLYCKSQGESIQLRETGKPDRRVEETSGTLISFLKSEQHIFIHKVSRNGDRLKVFDRKNEVFQLIRLPADHKLIKVGGNRITENIVNHEIFIVATLRIQDVLQEGVFCFEYQPHSPWNISGVTLLPYKACDRDIPTVFCGLPVILSSKDCRAYVLRRLQTMPGNNNAYNNSDGGSHVRSNGNDINRDNDESRSATGQWRELLSFPLVELDRTDYELIYVYSTRRKLYLVVEQDQDVRVVCYEGLEASRRDVTVSTSFPRARLDYERGVFFCIDED